MFNSTSDNSQMPEIWQGAAIIIIDHEPKGLGTAGFILVFFLFTASSHAAL